MRLSNKNGLVLILTFIILTAMTTIVCAFLYMGSVQSKAMGNDTASAKALWLAEAGLQKAVWNLKTPVAGGGKGEDWVTSGTTESLGNGSYKMEVARWDFALSANGSTASASSEASGFTAANAIDNNNVTYWESTTQPSVSNPEEIIITFPYSLTINKVRFVIPDITESTPRNYTWEVSSNGVSYTVAATITSNSDSDRIDTFSAVSNVKYLKLKITLVGVAVPPRGSPGVPRARIATLEAIGAKVTSTATVDTISRKIEQAAVADDATQTASNQKDWDEIVPAI